MAFCEGQSHKTMHASTECTRTSAVLIRNHVNNQVQLTNKTFVDCLPCQYVPLFLKNLINISWSSLFYGNLPQRFAVLCTVGGNMKNKLKNKFGDLDFQEVVIVLRANQG